MHHELHAGASSAEHVHRPRVFLAPDPMNILLQFYFMFSISHWPMFSLQISYQSGFITI